MNDIFREEALAELHSRGGPGDVLRSGPRWLLWSFALLVVLIGLSAAAVFTVPLQVEAQGTVTVGSDGHSVEAVLPLAYRGDVQPGTALRLEFGATRRTARVASVEVRPDGLVARSRLASPLPDKAPRTGRASALLGSETLYDLLRG